MSADLRKLRKKLHRNPEVSGNEKNTSDYIRKILQEFQPDKIYTGLGGYGILAHYQCKSGNPRKSILFRAELDAISVQEETGLEYQSKYENVMHGCGHDGHMTILVGLAQQIQKNRPQSIDIFLLFQPAEETGEGASKVLEQSVFQNIEIDHGFALHNLPGFPEKTIICKEGTFAAGSVGIEITVKGRYSHAAYPEQGLNPSTTMATLIQKIDSKMDSFRSEADGNKLVCTYIKMGERAFGISPGKAKTGYTIRSEDDEKLEMGFMQIVKIIQEVSKTYEGEISFEKAEPFKATINSETGTEIIRLVSEEKGFTYQKLDRPFPWSEDFGEFRRKFPITIFGVGSGENAEPLHSEKYDFNDELLSVGIDMFSGIVDYCSSL